MLICSDIFGRIYPNKFVSLVIFGRASTHKRTKAGFRQSRAGTQLKTNYYLLPSIASRIISRVSALEIGLTKRLVTFQPSAVRTSVYLFTVT